MPTPVQAPQAPLPQGTLQQVLRALQGQAIVAGSATVDRLSVAGTIDCQSLTARVSISLGGPINFAYANQTTVGAAGGAAALPATPSKYIKVKSNGVNYVIPAYLP